MTSEGSEERFHPTSGRVGGVLGIVLAALIAGAGLFDSDSGYAFWVYPACGLAALISWSMLLRPTVSVADRHLRLRQPFSTQVLPLAAIDDVGIGRVLEVRVDGKRYVSAAIGRSHRDARRATGQPADVGKVSYADVVQGRITDHVEAARRAAGSASPGDVRRIWAWPEISAGVVGLVALVVSLLV